MNLHGYIAMIIYLGRNIEENTYFIDLRGCVDNGTPNLQGRTSLSPWNKRH
jgi:hypothetical protein